MKEKYLRPAVVNAGTLEGESWLPFVAAIAAAAAEGYAVGKTLKSVFGVSSIVEKSSSLTKRKNFKENDNDFCLA